MVLAKLEQELNLKMLRLIYVLYGEEKYLIESVVNKIKKNFGHLQEGINYCYLDETNIENIISEIETPSFGSDKKLIIVKKAGLLNKETKTKKTTDSNKEKASKSEKDNKKPSTISTKLAQYIEENLNVIKQSVVIVIIEEKAEKCILYDFLKRLEDDTINENNVAICEFQKLKLNELIDWLKKICGLYKVQVESNVLAYLIEVSGTSMQNLMNEIRKLIEYVGEGGKVTKEDVQLLAVQEVDNIIFNLTDNLGVRDTKKALETLNDLIYLKEPLQSIMVNLYRHFKKLYFVKLSESDSDNTNIAEALDLKPNQMFLVTKYKKQAAYFKEEELRRLLRDMLDLDENYKSGNIDALIGLETLIMSI